MASNGLKSSIEDENFWMSQGALAELFGVKIPAISKHLKNIFESGELAEEQVVSILETTTQHGAIEGKRVFGKRSIGTD